MAALTSIGRRPSRRSVGIVRRRRTGLILVVEVRLVQSYGAVCPWGTKKGPPQSTETARTAGQPARGTEFNPRGGRRRVQLLVRPANHSRRRDRRGRSSSSAS